MSATDSRTAGVLPILSEEGTDDALDALRQLIATLTGIDLTNVRRRYYARPGSRPAISDDWCAVGIERLETLGTPDQTRVGGDLDNAESGYVIRVTHQNLHMNASFYGPNAMLNADRLRAGIQVGQSFEWLKEQGLTFKYFDGDSLHLPDLLGEQWVDRYDVRFVLGRAVKRTFGVRNLAALGDIEIITDTHQE
jgi:hypothetical protein